MIDVDSVTMTDSDRVKNIKKFFFENAHKSRIGHLPSALSCLEILYTLYNKVANITKQNKGDINRDRVILSKEHAKFGQVCTLFECGLVEKIVVDTYLQDGGFCGHDMYNIVGSQQISAIDISCGSLGHGLGVGAGIAFANRKHNVYVIVGDGELQEGSCWEALMFIGHLQLKNIVVIVDRNNQQIDNLTKNIINTHKFCPNAIKAFDFEIIECNGHSVAELEQAIKSKSNQPKCVVANTIKGKEIHNNLSKYNFATYHWGCTTDDEYREAILKVDNG